MQISFQNSKFFHANHPNRIRLSISVFGQLFTSSWWIFQLIKHSLILDFSMIYVAPSIDRTEKNLMKESARNSRQQLFLCQQISWIFLQYGKGVVPCFVVQYNNNAKLSIISHEPLIDDYQHLRSSLNDKVRHVFTRCHVFNAQLDRLEVVPLESLSYLNGRTEVTFGEDEIFNAIVGLLEHLLVVGLALYGIPGAYLLGHRGEYSIMVAKEAATHDVVVFANKFDVFNLLEALPVPMPCFDVLFYLAVQLLRFFGLWPVAKLSQGDLGLHAFLALLCAKLILQMKIKEFSLK